MKIGVFLPHRDGGGTLRSLKNIARLLHLGSRAVGVPVEVVVSVVAGYDIELEFMELAALGITVRETRWAAISADEVKTALLSMGNERELHFPNYWLPTDLVCNFHDCDFWLIVSDRTEYPVAPVKPYAMMIWDYIQRYVPEIFEGRPLDCDISFIASARGAAFVMTNMQATAEDIVQYAGIAHEKVVFVPTTFDMVAKDAGANARPRPYLVWVTNSIQHKNHLRALDALESYYDKHDGSLDVVVTGGLTELFSAKPSNRKMPLYDHPYPVSIRKRVAASESLRKRVHFLGELSDQGYVNMLAHAAFLFHPVLYDNGTFSVLEAANYRIPSLSSDYPQMREIDAEFGLHMKFCDPYRPDNMATCLKDMELDCEFIKAHLPDGAKLASYTPDVLAECYWRSIESPIMKAIHG